MGVPALHDHVLSGPPRCPDGHACAIGGNCPRILGICLKVRGGDAAYIALARSWPGGRPDRPGMSPDVSPPPSEPDKPSLWRQATGFAATARDVVVHAAVTGEVRADEPTRAARLAVCTAGSGLPADQVRDGHCDHYRPSDGRCGAADGCGCYLAGPVGKASFRAATCPLGRWPESATG